MNIFFLKKMLVALLDYLESAPLTSKARAEDLVFAHVSDPGKSSNVKFRVSLQLETSSS